MADLIDRDILIEELKKLKFPCMLPAGIDYLDGVQTAVTAITGVINNAASEPTTKEVSKSEILERCKQIELCLCNCFNTGSYLLECDYDFIEKQLGFIRKELSESE